MSEIIYGLQIDVHDNVTATNADIGLYYDANYSGSLFRWITGRPGYAGSGYSGEADASQTWKQGIFTDASEFSPITRMAKGITQTGGYGSMSGFDCVINNASDFISTIETAGYYIINRPAKLFVFIDDVSYQIWTGKLAGYEYDGLKCRMRFEDTFKDAHKPFPPDTFNKTAFSAIATKNDGDPIPVCLGDVPLAELKNVNGQKDPIVLAYYGDAEHTKVCAENYTSGTKKLSLRTAGRTFRDGELTGYFVRVVSGGDDAVYQIYDQTETDTSGGQREYLTEVTLLTAISGTPVVMASIPAEGATYDKDLWYFSIIDLNNVYIVSNREINAFSRAAGRLASLKYYNKNSDKYTEIGEIGQRSSVNGISNLLYPGIDVVNKSVTADGDIIKTFTIAPKSVKMSADDVTITEFYGTEISSTLLGRADHENLRDRDVTTNYEYVIDSGITVGNVAQFAVTFIIEIDALDEYDFDELYVMPDISITATEEASTYYINMAYSEYNYLNVESEDVISSTQLYTNAKSLPANTETNYHVIPTYHYNETLLDISDFDSKKASFNLQSDFTDTKRLSNNKIAVTMNFSLGFLAQTRVTVKFKEFAIIGKRTISLTSETLYTSLEGELGLVSVETNNIYTAIEHVLKRYDELEAAEIDFGTLEYHRKDWHLGRQITKRKSSFDYLDELAQHSFMGIYPNRHGQRAFVCFREQGTAAAAHDESIVKAGSITPFQLSDIYDTYNDFRIEYNYDPGRDKYTKSLIITHADESAFPAEYESTGTDNTKTFSWARINLHAFGQVQNLLYINFGATDPTSWADAGDYITLMGDAGFTVTFAKIIESGYESSVGYLYAEFTNTYGLAHMAECSSGTLYHHATSNVQKWKTYVSGISDYATSKDLWDLCHENYSKTLTVNRLPDKLSKLPWFIDRTAWEDGYGEADNSAYKYLRLCVEWLCRQKYITEYTVPLAAATAVLELYDYITLSDDIFTGGNARGGYINKLKLNPAKSEINIELVMIPSDLDEIDLIIETGSAADTITESGSQTDTITEGAQ